MTRQGRRHLLKPHLRLITLIGVIVPGRLRADWRQEWAAELQCREALLADWERLTWRTKLDLLRRSLGAFWDALWLQSHRWEDEMIQDLRFGVRMLGKSKGFTLVAVLSLALGVGANTAVFSLIDAVLWRPLPVPHPERLVAVYTTAGDGAGYRSLSWADYAAYREGAASFAGLAAWARIPVKWQNGEQDEQVGAEIVTGNFFDVLGLKAARGRLLAPDDDRVRGAHPVAVVSQRFWQRRLASDPEVVGRRLNLNGHEFVVIGVVPEGFSSVVLDWGRQPDLWLPMAMQPQALPQGGDGAELFENRDARWLLVTGRLKDGVALARAAAELKVIAAGLAAAFPQHNYGRAAAVLPVGEARFWPEYRQEIARFLTTLEVVAVLVLLIACFNVANLLLARARERQRETAVRLALGAGRGRLLRQSLTESLLLALLAAGAGLVIAAGLLRLLPAFPLPFKIPLAIEPRLDVRVLGFTLLAAVCTSLIFGLAPALQATRPNLVDTLKGGAGGGRRGRAGLSNLLVVAQVALSLVVLAGAGLLARSFWHLRGVELGFNPDRVLLVQFDLDPRQFTRERGLDFYRQLLDRVRALPGVEAASLTKNVPLDAPRMKLPPVAAEGAEPQRQQDWLNAAPDYVSPGYFRTLAIGLLAGRDFDAGDAADAPPTVVINQTLAARLWPGQDPLGRRMKFMGGGAAVTVVGVAPDVKYRALTEPPQPYYYLPFGRHYFGEMTLQVRAAGEPLGLVAAVRRAARELDAGAFISEVNTVNGQLSRVLSQPRLAATFASALGLVALALAALGLYSVMAYAVARRTREIGVRVALGAQRRDVLRLVVGQGMRLALAGGAAGLLGALALARLLGNLLFGVGAGDPLTFLLVAALVGGVAWLACWLPARRATKVDPLVALRHE